ncbi:MAG: HAMP domain-containing sensor histidine kinase [Burkholderiales bacterium]
MSSLSAPVALNSPGVERPENYWRSLLYFNVYRCALAVVLTAIPVLAAHELPFGSADPELYQYVSVLYVLFSAACFVMVRMRLPSFGLQLLLQVTGDIAFIILLMLASGGISSGLGLLLLASLAAGGLIGRGRLTLFHAALASIAVLGAQAFTVATRDAPIAQLVQAGLLSIGYFATAWLAHTLARWTAESEQLAAQRGFDLANLAQVNQLVIQDMQDGVLVVDAPGVIRQYNAQAEELLGAMPRARRDVLLSDYAPALGQQLARWRADPAYTVEPIASIDPQTEASVRFVRVGRADYLGAVIFLEDLGRVQGQAQQLKLASLGRLTANIAHEIRNPLSAINHATELLQEEPQQSPTQTRLLQIIHDNAQRLDRMVQDVLKLNRRDRALKENFDVGAYLDTFVEQFSAIEKINPMVFSIELADRYVVAFDRSHLNQVMWNLSRNALRHCQRKAGSIRVLVGLGNNPSIMRLDVIDDGPGVPKGLISQLFEPFFTTAVSGTGLGLYIAREVCQANGASLYYSDAPTGGAQFTILCKRANT